MTKPFAFLLLYFSILHSKLDIPHTYVICILYHMACLISSEIKKNLRDSPLDTGSHCVFCGTSSGQA